MRARKSLALAGVIVAGIGGLVAVCSMTLSKPVVRTSVKPFDPDKAQTSLRNLLARNDLLSAKLPLGAALAAKKFSTAKEILAHRLINIESQDWREKGGALYTQVILTYRMASSTIGQHVFVFADSGNCVFHGQQGSPTLPDGGFGNITGTGHAEQMLLRYGAKDTPSLSRLSCTVTLYRMQPTGAIRLAEIEYVETEASASGSFSSVYSLSVNANNATGWHLGLHGAVHNVDFTWNAPEQRYEAIGPASEQWKMISDKEQPR